MDAGRRHGLKGALLFLNLDRFKEINDSQGHAVGDLALVEVARRFQRLLRKEETLARLRSVEHTSELPSLLRISYAVFCLKKKKQLYTCHERRRIPTKIKRDRGDATD